MEPGIISQLPNKDEKPFWSSKTQWASLLVMLAPIVYPPAAVWIAGNPEIFSAGLGAVFSILRLVSKDKILIK